MTMIKEINSLVVIPPSEHKYVIHKSSSKNIIIIYYIISSKFDGVARSIPFLKKTLFLKALFLTAPRKAGYLC